MKNIQIEKKVPIPVKRNEPKYPFLKMKKGESFFVRHPKATRKDHQGLCSAANQHHRRHGTRFTVRKVAGGFRVWRTE